MVREGVPNAIQNPLKNQWKKHVQKVLNKRVICMEKSCKVDTEIYEKMLRFRNSQFLVFGREYNVKIVFLHDQGY